MNTKNFESNEARETKNKQIAATRKATAEKRKRQECRVFHLKVVEDKLSHESQNALRLVFLEAKWLRNAALAAGWQSYDTKPTTVTVMTPKGSEQRSLAHLGSQVRQSVVASIGRDILNLSKAKNAGRNVGALKYSKAVNSIDLKQAGSTYRFRDKKVKIQGIPGWLRVRGLDQLAGRELANAKLLKKADGVYLAVTTYAEPTARHTSFKTDALGLDFGVKTHATLSDGREFNWTVQENERLKRLQRKLGRQEKGSKNRAKTLEKMGREYQKAVNKRNELANQFVHQLLEEAETVYFQDDNLASWKSRKSLARGGRSLQCSILGRVKQKLEASPRTVRVGRWAATTSTCVCGVKTPHSLEKRWFECSACGYRAPRDVHAAQNMIRMGSKPKTPVECGEATVEAALDSSERLPVKQETDGAEVLGAEASGSSAQM